MINHLITILGDNMTIKTKASHRLCLSKAESCYLRDDSGGLLAVCTKDTSLSVVLTRHSRGSNYRSERRTTVQIWTQIKSLKTDWLWNFPGNFYLFIFLTQNRFSTAYGSLFKAVQLFYNLQSFLFLQFLPTSLSNFWDVQVWKKNLNSE